MRKRWFLIGIIFLLLPWGMVGCWVAQEDYDALMVEYDGMRVRVESAESDLAAAQGEIQTVQSDLSAEQSKSAKLESDLSASQSKAAKLETDLAAEQSKSEELESDLSASQSKTKTLEGDLSAAQSKVKSLEADNTILKGKIDKAEPYGEILEKFFFVPAYDFSAEDIAKISVLIDKSGNAELQEKWTTYLDRPTDEHGIEFWFAVWDGLWEILYPGGAGA